jgi:dihydrolipoamide dehydrogenase
MPPIPGLVEARPWGNREATTASEPPESLVVLGGGVVGVELAQAWAWLGTRVAIVEGGPRLIGREEPFASAQVEAALRELGVDVRTGQKAVRVTRDGDVTVELADGTSASGAELLVAVGRKPTTDELGLETIGLEPGKAVEVGEDLRSPGHEWLYAVGDVNGRVQLTHMGKYQARLVADAILGQEVRLVSDGPLSPRVIFTDPQVAAVGHTLASAREAGLDVRELDAETESTAGGSFVGRGAPGTSRLVVDRARNVIVGATFTGPEVAELLHPATIAVVCELPLDRLAHAVPSFPTRSEIWLKLLDANRP